MITYIEGNPDKLKYLDRYIFQLKYKDGKTINVFAEAENIVSAWDGVLKQENMIMGSADNPLTEIKFCGW